MIGAAGIVVHQDGSCSIAGKSVSIPNVVLEEIAGDGASGVVFRGTHKHLDRTVAVKLWLTLRSGDYRDKFQQGIAEAKKADSVPLSRAVVRLFDAGEAAGHFYAVTEYFPGITLAKWLAEYRPNLGVRREMAVALLDEVVALGVAGVNHGDLHTKNILVCPPERQQYADFRIIDFGTSLFAGDERKSLVRHWRVFNETISRILYPFSCADHPKPPFQHSEAPAAIGRWYYEFIQGITPALIVSGATWLRDAFGPENYTAEAAYVRLVQAYLEQGILELNPHALGDGSAYWDYLRDDLKPAALVAYRQPSGYQSSSAREGYENYKADDKE